MRLFEFKDWTLSVREEVYGLSPFKKILKRDKSRNKDMAMKEVLFVFYYTDIKSDYLIITNEKEREREIIKDIQLPEDWKMDDVIKDAIAFYESKSQTVIGKLYKDAIQSVHEMSDYIKNTGDLLRERTPNGGTVTTLPMITSAQDKIPKIMQNLKAAEKEVLKEQVEMEGRMKGSKTMGMFEEGFTID
jgi:hypothetical protein